MAPPSAHTRSKGPDPTVSSGSGVRLGRRKKDVPVRQPNNRVIDLSQRKVEKDTTPVCRDYMKGRCSRGSLCEYEHPPVCRNFLRGKCTRKCKYAHPIDPALFEYHYQMLEIEWDEKVKENGGDNAAEGFKTSLEERRDEKEWFRTERRGPW